MERGFRLGSWLVEPSLNTISRNGTTVHLEPKVMAVLVCLAECAGDAVSKDDLMRAVWSDTFVSEGVLVRSISELRRVFEDNAREPWVIQTIPKRGYRLLAPVVPVNGGSGAVLPPPSDISGHSRSNEGAGRHRFPILKLALLVVAMLFLAGVSPTIYRHMAATHPARLDFQNMKMTKLTDIGRVGKLAISPDGRYVAYTLQGPQQSLWVRQVASGSAVQVVPPSRGAYLSAAFSPDGDYLYFVRDNDGYVVPVLGGTPKLIIHDTYGGVAVSQDGRKLAFYHAASAPQSELIVSNADGTDQRVIARHPRSSGIRFFTHAPPSWSPDGRFIAMPVLHETDTAVNVYPLDGGAPRVIPSPGMVSQALWLPDQGGLLVTTYPSAVAIQSRVPEQIWLLPVPTGEPQRLTNDLDAYRSLAVSRDGKLLAAVHVRVSLTVYVGPASHPDQVRAITTGVSDGIGLKWMPDGTLLSQSVQSQFSRLSPEGKERVPLFEDDVFPGAFSVCDHGRFVVFMRETVGEHSTIWRTDATGRNAQPITHGPDDFAPHCSPDGRFVAYVSETQQSYRLMKVPIEGGSATVLSDSGDVAGLQYSPDGRQIADIESTKDHKIVIVVRDSQNGAARKTFEVLSSEELDFNAAGWNLQWTPDGRALTYALHKDGAVNLWSQPLSGGLPRPITHFPDQVVAYDWSPDGKRLAVTRMTDSRDAVVISNFR